MKKYYLITRILSCDENQIKEKIQLAAKYNDFAHIGFLKGIIKRRFE